MVRDSSVQSGRRSKAPSKTHHRIDGRLSLSVSEEDEDEIGIDDVVRHMKHNYN